jgi:hypothetical protein
MNKMLPPNWVRPVTPEDLPALEDQAAQDRHSVIAPTHLFLKHGQPVGYASVGAIMLVLPWFDTRKCMPRDSYFYVNMLENLVAASAADTLCVPVAKISAFEPVLPSLGYTSVGDMNVMFKKVKG